MLVVLTTLAATFFIQIGYFLWKLSADRQPRIGTARFITVIGALVRDWRWVLGLISTSAGWLLFVQASALGEISLIQPLMSVGDLLLVLLAVVFLHERLAKFEWLGLALTVLGAVALSWQADARPASTTGGTRLWLLTALIALAVVSLALLSRRIKKPEVSLAILVGLAFGAGAILTEALTAGAAESQTHQLIWRSLINPVLIAVIIANVIGLIALQAAFQRGRASVIIPVQLAIANAITVLAGLVVFDEHIGLIRGLGVALVIGGTAFLKTPNTTRTQP